jgi:hypothetical protein
MRDRVSTGSSTGRGYPGHGAVLENTSSRITEYIKHRQQREDEVLRVLRYGKLDVDNLEEEGSPGKKKTWTPIELVRVIYRDVPENLHLPASNGILLVLEKLREEGRVALDEGNGWRLSERSAL